MGVQEGHRVALLAANGLPYVAFVHALTRLGAILVPLNLRLTLEESYAGRYAMCMLRSLSVMKTMRV